VEGLRFRYAPLVVPVGGIVFTMAGPGGGLAPADGCLVRDCEVSLGAFEGMTVRGGARISTVIEDCWVHHNGNGCGGFEGHGAADTDAWLVVRRCRFTDNNLFRWNSIWHAGRKHFGTRVFFEECEFARSHFAPGLWFDCKQRDGVVQRCYAHDNGQFGLYYEIGETGAFLNSVIEGHPHCCAVALNGSSRCLVAHNLIRAPERGIIVGWEGNIEGQAARVTCHNAVWNNLLLGGQYPLITISPERDIARGNRCDHNLLWRTDRPPEGPPESTWALFEDTYASESKATLNQWRERRSLDLASTDRAAPLAPPGCRGGGPPPCPCELRSTTPGRTRSAREAGFRLGGDRCAHGRLRPARAWDRAVELVPTRWRPGAGPGRLGNR
jgi:hypothetical protein